MKDSAYLEDLEKIRSMMERSSRFLSLSGISGILTGIYAFAGVIAAYAYLGIGPASDDYFHFSWDEHGNFDQDFYSFFFLDSAVVLILSILTAWYFTSKRAVRQGVRIWDSTARRLAINLLIPLVAGGIYSMLLVFHAQLPLVPGTMLIFYGLALVNAGKYSLDDIRYLGLIEIVMGILAIVFSGFGLLFWATGFGLLHIVYGCFTYSRYK